MNDNTIVITGASSGIGRALFEHFAHQGWFVIGTSTQATSSQALTTWLTEHDYQGQGLLLDQSNRDSVTTFAEAVKSLCPNGIYALINNAGITDDNLHLRMQSEQWSRVLDTNLSGLHWVTQALIKPMIKQKKGCIVNMTSIVASIGNAGQSNYCASKAGVIGYTKALAREYASRNITVNAVAPGFITTRMTDKIPEKHRENICNSIPLQRMGSVEDIVHGVDYLVQKATYVTGTVLHINGGMHM